jgi:hypothetical protein
MPRAHSFIGHEGGRQLFIRRALVFSPLIFFLAVTQCSFFAQLKILPAVPDLMIGVIVAIAMLDSQKAAVVCGISAGFVIDAIGASGLSFSPLFYMFCGALCGVFAKKMLPSFLSWAVNLTVFSILSSLFTLVNLLSRVDGISLLEAFTRVLLPEMICTYIVCLPIFFIVKLCMIPIDSKRRLRLDKFN